MKIYVASSWRNLLQPAIVSMLRSGGHDVYDFRHPAPGVSGFAWSEIDPNWKTWTPSQYREALHHPVAARGYGYDIGALNACDAVVYVLPCGRSASWEFGYAMGQGKPGYVVAFEPTEPELMFRGASILTCPEDLFDVFGPAARFPPSVLNAQGVPELGLRWPFPGSSDRDSSDERLSPCHALSKDGSSYCPLPWRHKGDHSFSSTTPDRVGLCVSCSRVVVPEVVVKSILLDEGGRLECRLCGREPTYTVDRAELEAHPNAKPKAPSDRDER